uniref:Uncharacterized protein n=1 Tax=Branchiostoma floridae TaxID=7739 RepID=C3Y9S8_BRAFL|eukprot:XP_002606827.1 hypothetical protein BRAFLDRAFT_103575 [Branchiostoma floridae]
MVHNIKHHSLTGSLARLDPSLLLKLVQATNGSYRAAHLARLMMACPGAGWWIMTEPLVGSIRRYTKYTALCILLFSNVGMYYFLKGYWNIEYIYANQLGYLVTSPKSTFRVGEELSVVISARHKHNMTANVGDFLRASISTSNSRSSAVGIIKDNADGTYTVTFRLLWTGNVKINIQLISSRQTVDIIERTALDFPADKVMFRRRYQNGSKEEVQVLCNVYPEVLHGDGGVCNYSDPHAGARWFCEKAVTVPCDAWGFHGVHMYRAMRDMLEKGEESRFRKYVYRTQI